MANKYDKNGYNSSDFKRNSNQNSSMQDGDGPTKINEKADEYMRDLLAEKIKLNNEKFPISCKLIDEEVGKVQSMGRIPQKEAKYMDVIKEKPVKVTVKVLVPVKEFPKFNFVGKLLGPKGATMKQLQEETMCKMAVLGRGSMKDRQKEEELRNSLDPKYSHLSDELHVEVSALAPPAEAHARIAYALAEVKKYLIPDPSDMFRQHPMGHMMDGRGGPGMHPPRPGPPGRGPPRMAPGPPPMGHGRPPMPGGKSKVISILDRARSAMDETAYSGYEDYAPEPPVISQGYSTAPPRGPPRSAPQDDFYYERNERYYEEDPYFKEAPTREYKTSSRGDQGSRRPGPTQRQPSHYARASPYARPSK